MGCDSIAAVRMKAATSEDVNSRHGDGSVCSDQNRIKPLYPRSTLNQPLCHVHRQLTRKRRGQVHETKRAAWDYKDNKDRTSVAALAVVIGLQL